LNPLKKLIWSVLTEKEKSGVKTQEVAADVVRGKSSNVGKGETHDPKGDILKLQRAAQADGKIGG
jgi:hypothetical protein